MTRSEQAALELALESGVPYQGLRGSKPDPNLLLYMPAALARGAEIVPLSLQDNVLQLASISPHPDLAAMGARFPRLALDVCVSPADEIRDVLAGMRERTI